MNRRIAHQTESLGRKFGGDWDSLARFVWKRKMRNRILRLAAVHMVVMGVAFATQGRLTVALLDLAEVPEDVRLRALKVADRVFADAHIRAEWSICNHTSSACIPLVGSEDHSVIIHVVSKATTARPAGPLPDGDLAGYAPTGSGYGYVFYDAIQDFARKSKRPPSLILGCVLVHEIAHTLGLAHQFGGLMRPDLHPHDMLDAVRGLAFTPSEVRQLRAAVVRLNADFARPGN
jgi:hypothetical protein